ncbi:MAG: hypothetical protein JWO66_332, partial [Candidatus Eremiobacteraeota bacterium]|nr:hypothetical protein [Candidatus Eremiobacteraeota bacterium]
ARHAVMMPSALMIRRDLLDAVGGSDESIRGLGEDIELELRLLVHSDALFVDAPLMGYRRHGANLTANRSAQRASPLEVAERVAAAPSRYLPSTVNWYRREGAALRFIAGRMAAAEGDHASARRYLRASLRERPAARTLAWLLVSYAIDNPLGRTAMRAALRARFARRAHVARP